MTRLRSRPSSDNQPAGEPGLSTKTTKTERFACPFERRFPSTSPISKTCRRGSPDIRHVKEHVKNHHKCNCPQPCATTTASGATCSNPLHTTPTQLLRLRGMKRRLKTETESNHWMRVFHELFPDVPNPPMAPRLPTSAHLQAMADAMPDEFADAFATRLNEASLLPMDRSGVEAARLFGRQHAVYVEMVSSWGLGPSRPMEPSGDSSMATSSRSTQSGGEHVDTSGAEMVEPEMRLEPHNTVVEWIDEDWST